MSCKTAGSIELRLRFAEAQSRGSRAFLKLEHIDVTGDYHWRRDGGLRNRKLRPLWTAFVQPATLL